MKTSRFRGAALVRVLFACLLGLAPLAAQVPKYSPGEVGVEEKLGQTVLKDAILRDEEGRAVRLGEVIDKPTILTLNFFRCSGVCTPQLMGVLEVLDKVKATPGQDFQVVTVSFDDRDTPEMAWQKRANYLQEVKRPCPPTAWRFLTGQAAATRAVCDSVGFRFKREGDGFAHAAVLVVLSPQGRITRYIYGVNYFPEEMQQAITEAARGEARPTVNKWLKFCYTSDSAGKGTVFSATRLTAALTLLALALFAIILAVSSRRKRLRTGERV